MKENTQSKKILIVDDEPDIIEFLQYNLKKEGFSVVSANDGNQAITVAEKEKPDLIILDIMMPEMDGVETCRLLRSRQEFASIPVAFLTARDEDFSQIAALDVGGDDYITKPIKPRVLISRIQALLRRVARSMTQISKRLRFMTCGLTKTRCLFSRKTRQSNYHVKNLKYCGFWLPDQAEYSPVKKYLTRFGGQM